MADKIRILLLEDESSDGQHIEAELRRASLDFTMDRVKTEQDLLSRLEASHDVILADYSNPQFNALRAVRLLRQRGLDVPFIIVSGAMGEDIAVAAMKEGAHDYLVKDRIGRLGESVKGLMELKESRESNRRSKAALRESERRFSDMLENVHLISLMLDRNAQITYCNEFLLRLTGWKREEVIGRNWFEVFTSPEAEDLKVVFEAVMKDSPSARHQESAILTHSGEQRMIHWNNSVLRSAAGDIVGTASIGEDITEGKRAAELQAQLAAIVESSDDAIIGKTLSGIVTSWNSGAERIFGYVANEIIGQPISLLVLPDRRTEQDNFVSQLDRGEHIDHIETVRRCKDGTLRDVSLSVSPVRDAAGKLIGASTIIRDITARKLSEVEISEKEVQYRRLFEAAKDGILILDALNGKITDCNPFLTSLLGYSQGEMLGKELWQIGTPEDIVAFKAAFVELQEKEYIRFDDMPLMTKNGHQIDVEFVSNSYKVNDKLVMQCNIRDISERRTLEAQLRQSQKMEGIGQLAGGIAHDFNNLLTIINGRSQLLIGRFKTGEKVRNDLELIYKTGERAAALTRQLLAFSRKQVLQPVVLDLNFVAGNLDKMLRRLIREDIELVTILDPALKQIKADPGQIEQIIMNLVVNARDAMPDGGKLTIETSNIKLSEEYCRTRADVKPGRYVMLVVSDTGEGMNAIVKARIFEPFFTTKPQGKGTGLGLSTVFGIVKQSNGYIDVVSEVDKGTTFRIYFPRTEEKSVPGSGSHSAVPLGRELILVVEDEDGVRELVRDLLEMNGYTVLTANNGNDALRVCQNHGGVIDLMVTDVVMPEMGGTELVERMKILHPETKVLFTSGYTDHAIVLNGELAAGIAFIQKPFTPANLARKVRERLDEPVELNRTTAIPTH